MESTTLLISFSSSKSIIQVLLLLLFLPTILNTIRIRTFTTDLVVSAMALVDKSSSPSSSSSSQSTHRQSFERPLRGIISNDNIRLLNNVEGTGRDSGDVNYGPYDGIFEQRRVTLPTTNVQATIVYGHPTIINDDNNKNNARNQHNDDGTMIASTKLPPLLFLHGSFHGSWCWEEHWIPYFVSHGYQCVALNWRGTSGTHMVPSPDDDNSNNSKKVKISEHCDDLRGLLQILPSILNNNNNNRQGISDRSNDRSSDDNLAATTLAPILVSHSMGGIYVMKYLEEEFQTPASSSPSSPSTNGINLSGIVTFCSTPPSGNGPSTFRVLRRSLRDAYRITVGFVLKRVNTDSSICRQCFFGGSGNDNNDNEDDNGVSDDDLARYQSYFEKDSKVVLDVSDLSKHLPSKLVDKHGRAPFIHNDDDNAFPVPRLVVGATKDFIVDTIGNEETATYYGLDTPQYVDSPHDIMLGRNWNLGAVMLKDWIETNAINTRSMK